MQHPADQAPEPFIVPADALSAPDTPERQWLRENVVLVVLARDEGDRLERLLASARAQGVEATTIRPGRDVWAPDAPEASIGFGAARQDALNEARAFWTNKTWALLLDADMQLMGDLSALVPWLSANPHDSAIGAVDNIHLIQKDSIHEYDNVRLVRLRPERRCLGRTHELWQALGPSITDNEKRCWILDHCDGANRGAKYERDEHLLRLDLAEDPSSERAVFYLAQTLDGAGKLDEAIELYSRRAGMGGFEQEAWMARYRAGLCLLRAAQFTRGVGTLLDAWARKPWRAEPLYQLGLAYQASEQHEAVMGIADLLRGCEQQDGDLFAEPWAFDFGGDDLVATSSYHVQDQGSGLNACERMLVGTDQHVERNLERVSWYLDRLDLDQTSKPVGVLSVFLEGARWLPTNPCITAYGTNVRLVNYDQERGRCYVSRDKDGKIRTRNIWQHPPRNKGSFGLVTVQQEWNYTLDGAETDHEIQGLEDVRFHRDSIDGVFAVFTATCCECPGEQGNPQVVIGVLDLNSMHADVRPIKYPDKQKYEKNWTILDTDGKTAKILYSLNPTVVLTVVGETGEVIETRITPGRCKAPGLWRNSTPPVLVEGNSLYLMLAHDVGRRADQNVYMHRWVWLDLNGKVIQWSDPFTIKHTGIEYACGLQRITPPRGGVGFPFGALRISFGVNDREAWTLDVPIPELHG